MDSLTQITLGAACGEIVLGRKIGNRALLWGAIGGTIPDLDVLANLFVDSMTALAFHRHITHSLLFAVVAPALFGFLVHRFYQSGMHDKRGYKMGLAGFWVLLLMLLINLGAYRYNGGFSWSPLVVSALIALALGFILWRYYVQRERSRIEASFRGWYLLFLASIGTHPILDCCTPFGTQLFQPFSNYRVAWDNISVVDPMYTVPFLLCLIVAGFLKKSKKGRMFFTWLGIGLSCLYMAFTLYNKHRVNCVFEQSYEREGITYNRKATVPTILNNFLWQGIAEGDTAYYQGFYSIMDPEPEVTFFNTFPKNHHLLEGHEEDRDVRILRWFTKGYYSLLEREEGRIQFNNMRYGIMRPRYESPKDFVFTFLLEEDSAGVYRVVPDPRQDRSFSKEDFHNFLNRVMGK